MMASARRFVRQHWPRLRLRTILLATLLFTAALPGFGAVFLRVYENTLVRQTESELVAQSVVLASVAHSFWPGAALESAPPDFRPEPPSIDLSETPILPERPPPVPAQGPLDPDAAAVNEKLSPIMRETRRTTLAAIQLLDRNGRVVSGPETGASYAAVPEVAAALRGQTETVLRRNGSYQQVYRFEWLTRAAAIRIHHARPVVVNGKVAGVLLLSRSPRALFRGIYQDIGKIAIGAIGIFVILVFLAGLLSRGIARPIERLSDATRNLSRGQGEPPPVPETAAIEIQALYRDFATMAQAIERRSRYLRDFAYAVSHEFKTPLAGIAGAVELLQDHGKTMSEPERRQFLANISADALRLNNLLTGVLDLARADMTSSHLAGNTDVRLPVLRVADAYSSSDIRMKSEFAAELPPVTLPAPALETCLSNLIENSRRAGAAQIAVSARAQEGAVLIEVQDDGPGIAEGDRSRIFEPFFTTRRESGGTGLGLSIVKSLLEAHGGTIVLREGAGGAHFTLTLPASSLAAACEK